MAHLRRDNAVERRSHVVSLARPFRHKTLHTHLLQRQQMVKALTYQQVGRQQDITLYVQAWQVVVQLVEMGAKQAKKSPRCGRFTNGGECQRVLAESPNNNA